VVVHLICTRTSAKETLAALNSYEALWISLILVSPPANHNDKMITIQGNLVTGFEYNAGIRRNSAGNGVRCFKHAKIITNVGNALGNLVFRAEPRMESTLSVVLAPGRNSAHVLTHLRLCARQSQTRCKNSANQTAGQLNLIAPRKL
jgi:hypothetical protein